MLFLFVFSSGIIWEFKKKRYKAMSVKECRELEAAFGKFNNEKASGKKVKSRQTVDKMEVSLTKNGFKLRKTAIFRF